MADVVRAKGFYATIAPHAGLPLELDTPERVRLAGDSGRRLSKQRPPGERPQYHPGYYAAYVLAPDGNNVEVVNHRRA